METNNAENIENSAKNTVVNKQNEEINLLSLSVVRRDGSITPFKSDKIANAIRKAFLAQTDVRDNGKIDQTINEITETVTKLPFRCCLLYTSPSPRDGLLSRMPSSA